MPGRNEVRVSKPTQVIEIAAECDTQASGPQVTHENMPRNQE